MKKKELKFLEKKSNKTKNQFNRKKSMALKQQIWLQHTLTHVHPLQLPLMHIHTHTPNHAHKHARTHSLPPHTHRPTQSCFTSGSMESAATGAGPSDDRRKTSKLGWLPGGLKLAPWSLTNRFWVQSYTTDTFCENLAL